MEYEVVAGGTEVFCVDVSLALASFARFNFGLPFEFFIAGVTESFGVVFFFLIAIDTNFYHHSEKKRSHIKKFVQTG